MRLTVADAISPSYFVAIAAVQLGFFKDEGVDMEFVFLGAGPCLWYRHVIDCVCTRRMEALNDDGHEPLQTAADSAQELPDRCVPTRADPAHPRDAHGDRDDPAGAGPGARRGGPRRGAAPLRAEGTRPHRGRGCPPVGGWCSTPTSTWRRCAKASTAPRSPGFVPRRHAPSSRRWSRPSFARGPWIAWAALPCATWSSSSTG